MSSSILKIWGLFDVLEFSIGVFNWHYDNCDVGVSGLLDPSMMATLVWLVSSQCRMRILTYCG